MPTVCSRAVLSSAHLLPPLPTCRTPGEAVPDFQIPRDAPYVPATAAIHIQDIVTEPLADKLAEVLVLGIAALGECCAPAVGACCGRLLLTSAVGACS